MITTPPIELGILGWADGTILMILALIVFGPHKLPQLGRQIGKLMYEFRKASNDFKFQMEEELRQAEEADRRREEETRQKQLMAESVPDTIEASVASTDAVDSTAETSPTTSPYPGEEQYPQINTPATGEPVSADWQGLSPETAAAYQNTSINEEKPTEETPAGTEQAAQHG